jgi:hypothetical protein
MECTLQFVFNSCHWLGEWQHRYAALMAISAIAEGCEKQMMSILGDVITSVLPYCQDSVS